MRIFTRVYYALVALTLIGCVCLPWLVPLSYWARGVDPRLVDAETVDAFQAHAATASLRRGFIAGVLLLALSLVVVSLAGLVRRARRRSDLPWAILVLTLIGAAGVAFMDVSALLASGSGICC